jgi:hypothetical protein
VFRTSHSLTPDLSSFIPLSSHCSPDTYSEPFLLAMLRVLAPTQTGVSRSQGCEDRIKGNQSPCSRLEQWGTWTVRQSGMGNGSRKTQERNSIQEAVPEESQWLEAGAIPTAIPMLFCLVLVFNSSGYYFAVPSVQTACFSVSTK